MTRLPAAAVAAVLLSCVACGGSHSQRIATANSPSRTASAAASSAVAASSSAGTASSSSAATASMQVSPTMPEAVTCPRIPAVLAAALSTRLVRAGSGRIIPVAVGPSGEVLASITGAEIATVSILSAGGGRHDLIVLPNPSADQLTGASLTTDTAAFFVSHSLYNPSVWTLYRYDRSSGALTKITENPGGAQHPQEGPFPQAVQAGHGVYWVEGAPGGSSVIRMLDLRTGAVSVFRKGHAATPFAYRNALYWMESDLPDTPSTVHTSTGPALPTAVAQAMQGASSVFSTGSSLAWVAGDGHQIERWLGHGPPETLYLTSEAEAAWDVHQFGSWVTWQTPEQPWAFDPQDKAVFPLTPRYGYVIANGTDLIVSYPVNGAGVGKGTTALAIEHLTDRQVPAHIHC